MAGRGCGDVNGSVMSTIAYRLDLTVFFADDAIVPAHGTFKTKTGVSQLRIALAYFGEGCDCSCPCICLATHPFFLWCRLSDKSAEISVACGDLKPKIFKGNLRCREIRLSHH
eukprot:scaffold23770_cov43-Attheya_sp.AAC.5